MIPHRLMKGIYPRGGVLWFQPPMVSGHRPKAISLHTADWQEGIKNRDDILAMPILSEGGTVMAEAEAHRADMLKRGKYTVHTERAKRGPLRRFAQAMGRKTDLSEVTHEMVKGFYLSELRRGLSPGTVHKVWLDIRALFTWAIAKGKIRVNPALGVESKDGDIQPVKVKPRVLYCEQVLQDQLINNCLREDVKFVLVMGFHAAMRFNEILHAVPEWFDRKHRIIKIGDTEHKKFNDVKRARDLSMRPEVEEFLKEYGMRRPFMLRPDKVLRARSWSKKSAGPPLYRWDFSLPLREYLKTQMWQGADCTWVTPHVMRHTFASLLLLQGVPPFIVAQAMGDSLKTVLGTYGHMNARFHSINLTRSVA